MHADADAHTDQDRRFHDETAHLYDRHIVPVFGVYSRAVTERLIDRIAPAGKDVAALDVGCGTGAVTLLLARRGLSVTGVDHSEGMLAKAREKVTAEGLEERVRLMTGDVRSLPFDAESFDLLTCQGVLHHLEDLPSVLLEFARVLRPGGGIYLADPCLGSNLGLRVWARVHSLVSRPGGEPVADHPELDPDALAHEEGPIDPAVLIDAVSGAGFDFDVDYSSEYPGLKAWPQSLQVPVLRAMARPWRRRSGNMMFVTGRRG